MLRDSLVAELGDVHPQSPVEASRLFVEVWNRWWRGPEQDVLMTMTLPEVALVRGLFLRHLAELTGCSKDEIAHYVAVAFTGDEGQVAGGQAEASASMNLRTITDDGDRTIETND